MFVIAFQVFFMCLMCFACVLDISFECFLLFHTYVAIISFECFKSRSGCCACCNVRHFVVAVYCSCWGVMHGGKRCSRRAGHGKQGSVGEWHRQGLPVRASGASTGVKAGTGVRKRGSILTFER